MKFMKHVDAIFHPLLNRVFSFLSTSSITYLISEKKLQYVGILAYFPRTLSHLFVVVVTRVGSGMFNPLGEVNRKAIALFNCVNEIVSKICRIVSIANCFIPVFVQTLWWQL